MAIPGLGDIQQIWEIGVRVYGFINDLRHAQDDFLQLRAEAECLHVSIRTLSSPACVDTLYLYITKEQGEDLKTILDSTEICMKDLNNFVGKYKAVVYKEYNRLHAKEKEKARQQGQLAYFAQKAKSLFAKAWATYRVSMNDPQPFRDKLALPTASINGFLTSMTHVGLVNMSALLGVGGVPLVNSGKTPIRSDLSRAGLGWAVKGKKVAFNSSSIISKSQLTEDMEDEIIRYVKHLLQGGKPYTAGGSSKDSNKDSGFMSGLSVVRRRSVHVPNSAQLKVTTATDKHEFPLAEARRQQALIGEHPPVLPRSRLLSDTPWTGGASGVAQGTSPSAPYHRGGDRYTRNSSRSPSPEGFPRMSKERSYTYRDKKKNPYSRSFKKSRIEIEEDVIAEQQEAADELKEKANTYIPEIRRTRLSYTQEERLHSHPADMDMNDEESIEVEQEALLQELEDTYGIQIEVLPVGSRPPVDNGTVRPVKPRSNLSRRDKHEISVTDDSSSSEDGEALQSRSPKPMVQGDRLQSQTTIRADLDYSGSTRTKKPSYRAEPYDRRANYRANQPRKSDRFSRRKSSLTRDEHLEHLANLEEFARRNANYYDPSSGYNDRNPPPIVIVPDEQSNDGKSLRRTASYGGQEALHRHSRRPSAGEDAYMSGARSPRIDPRNRRRDHDSDEDIDMIIRRR